MTCFEDESTSATHYVVISCGQSRAPLHYPLFSPLWYNVRSSFRVVLITACSNVTNTVYSLHEITWIVTHTVGYIHREKEKGNHISFMNKSFNMQCKLTKFSTVNWWHRIDCSAARHFMFTNRAIKVMKLMITAARAYSLGSTSLLRRILNARQNHIHGIVAYTFVNVCEKKFTSFCQVLKKMHIKENWFPFSASQCI